MKKFRILIASLANTRLFLLSILIPATFCVKASYDDDFRKISGYGNKIAYLQVFCTFIDNNIKAMKSSTSLEELKRINDHSKSEQARIHDHFVRKGVHDDMGYIPLYKSLVAAPIAVVLLRSAWYSYDKCKTFNPTVQEVLDAGRKKVLQHQTLYNQSFVQTSEIVQKSPVGQAKFAGSQHLANKVIAPGVASFVAGDKNKQISVDRNDIPRYRKYKNAAIISGTTGCIASVFSLYQFGKFINYPQFTPFVPNDFVPKKS